jgi:YebC/PmpR family DNA-binding regulatory protein
MAGHSKWANIQHRKGKQDAKRGKIFTKLIRAITVSARLGGGDINSNPRLRDAVEKAKNSNMTNDTIDRAIKKGAGGLDGNDVENVTYEGYGPGGVAVIVECLTDNRNRTVAEVRHAFSKCGGNLGTDGSVSYLFKRQGFISFNKNVEEDKIMMLALDQGAEDVVVNDDGSIDVVTTLEQFSTIKEAMLAQGLQPVFADTAMNPATTVELDEETARKMLKLQEMLEDLDDVQEVHSNADISQDILAVIDNS